MNIYSCYTDSHFELFQMMKESLEKTNPDLNLISEKFPQDCETGNFGEKGWSDTMHRKTGQILSAIKNEDVFIYTDADVYFLKPFKDKILEELGDYDIALQDDSISGLCTGFWIAKSSDRIYNLWLDAKNNIERFGNEQNALTSLIHRHPIRWKMLSRSTVFTYGHLGLGIWNNNSFEFDRNIAVAHANWTVGIENKTNLIKYIRNKIENQ